ncbi:MAG: phosphoribosylamine--glycine ligase [Clostridiales bacterium]|nr:phosphoribosylamine--glycine ligase [Clostridiales bacterium]
MKILVVGGGGREHAIIAKISDNPQVEHIYALPGNGGLAMLAECVPIKATDITAIRDFALEKKVDFVVVAPDDPLVAGAVNLLEEAGIPCFGPRKEAAIIEGSKVFAKELMRKYAIPTAACAVFEDANEAIAYCAAAPHYPLVIKADGLALGKGVLIAGSAKEAKADIVSIMQERVFGASGSRVVIEEFLSGPEVSVLAFTDGHTIVPMISSMDHKRAQDGDLGLNTGGMGALAPNPYYTDEIAKECMKKIYLPTIQAMQAEGRLFKGCLYFGLMLTERGPCVIEYNCRFGDPETQAVLPLLQSDLLTIMQAVSEERLHEIEVKFSSQKACCLVLASGGYPQRYETGLPIKIGATGQAQIYHAGTTLKNGALYTSGGRVLGITSLGATLPEAVEHAYQAAKQIEFQNMYYRRDIGQKALHKE